MNSLVSSKKASLSWQNKRRLLSSCQKERKFLYGSLRGMESLSASYQLLPFLIDYKLGRTNAPLVDRSVVLVVSPLVCLMIDQVRSLKSRGVSAAIHSSNRGIDKGLVTTPTEVSSGKYRLLYTAPEAVIEDHSWRMLLLEPPLSSSLVAIAVDKAHCVYKW